MNPRFWQTLLAAELPPAKSRALLQGLGSRFDDPDAILGSPILTAQDAKRAAALNEQRLAKVMDQGVEIMLPPEYPSSLTELAEGPPALFLWGDRRALFGPSIGIVGTRGATTYGKAVAMKFAAAFARAGVTVVSGGALGIDAAAHKGALGAGGRTVAVLAGGVDWVYPAAHAGLFAQIRESGCLVSQFAVGARPNYYKFLARNGLIAALSTCVLVVEAPSRSGALSTANAAIDLNRQVFVVPSNIDNLNFSGSHSLIRDGAVLVDHPDQILQDLDISPSPAAPLQQVTDVAAKILEVLSINALAPEFIVERTGLEASTVMSELTMLELDGLVFRDAGGYARKP